jgi:uncharacterized delta-60 repeat protein
MHKVALPTVLSTLVLVAAAGAQDPADPPESPPAAAPTVIKSFLPKLKPQVQAVTTDSEGRIVALGGSPRSSRNKPIKLARLLPDGKRDLTFGGTGVLKFNLRTDPDAGDTFIHDALAVDGDDRTYATIEPQDSVEPVGVVRLLADGSLDPDWGAAGVVWLDFGAETHLTTVTLDSDGGLFLGLSIQAEGTTDEPDPHEVASVASIDSEGALDETFGTDGVAALPDGDRVDDILVDSTRRLIVSTWNARGNGRDAPIYRLLPSGQVDPDFGDEGVGEEIGNVFDQEIALDDQDRVVISASAGRNRPGFELGRLNTDGYLDPDFGDENYAWFPVAGQIGGDNPIAIDDEGRIVLGGSVRKAPSGDGAGADRNSTDFLLMRLNPNGTHEDKSFGDDGTMQIDLRGQKDRLADLTLGPDGSIVAAGGSRVPGKRGLKGAVVAVPSPAE